TAQPHIQDRFCLLIAQLKTFYERGLGMIRCTQNGDDLIKVTVGDEQPFEQMQTPHYLVEAKLQAPYYRSRTKFQPFCQDLAQIFDLWPLVEANDVEIDAVGPFEIGGGKQMCHERGNVLAGGM